MTKVLVSACLLGEAVRYNGEDRKTEHPVLRRWLVEGRVVRFCPEVAGGLSVPRAPAERQGAVVRDIVGRDVSAEFQRGAVLALEAARVEGVRVAVLTDGSPSCGSRFIYDGTFTGRRVQGEGVTARLLRENGIAVFAAGEWEEADVRLAEWSADVG